MKLKTSSPRALPLGWMVLAALVSSFFPLGVRADLYTRFYVALNPQQGGSCLNYLPVLENMYNEALLMAQAAIDAIDNYGADPSVRAQLETYFGIEPNDVGDAVSPAQAGQLAYVRDWYQSLIADQSNTFSNNQPAIFCDESWLFLTQWDIDQNTGQYTGQTVFQATGGFASQILWSNVHGMLAGVTLQCDANTAAYTKTSPSAITICPTIWNSPTRLDSLADYRSGALSINDGTPLDRFESTPGTLLHEILHLISGYAIDDIEVNFNGRTVVASSPEQCAALASWDPAMAIINAESYTWFATASYLNLHDWSRTLAGTLSSAPKVGARADGNSTLTTTTTTGGQVGNDVELREMWHESKRKAPRSHRQSSSWISLEEMTEAR